MALQTRGTNTMSEGLRKLLSELTDLKVLDDADMPFLINLETIILQRLKQGADDAMSGAGGAGGGMGGGMGMPGSPAGLMGNPTPPPGMGTPPGTPGLMQGPSQPNSDELRRVLSQG